MELSARKRVGHAALPQGISRYLAGSLTVGGLGIAFVLEGARPGVGIPAGIALVLGQALPLVLLDRSPAWAFTLSEAANAAYGSLGYRSSPVSFAPYVALAVLASRRRRAGLGALAAAVGVVGLIGSQRTVTVAPAGYLANVAVVLAFFVSGRELASWRTRHSLSVERLRAATDLEAASGELTRMSERLELTRELHDTLGHALAVVRLEVQLASKVMSGDLARAREALQIADRRACEALKQVQALLGRIGVAHPLSGHLTHEELQYLVTEVGAGGLEVALLEDGSARQLAPLISHALYRVVQEALTNVLRHAGAQHAFVTVTWKDDGVRLRISDDGKGGQVDLGAGLIGMTERVKLLGGRLSVGPAAEGGVMIEAYLPLPLQASP